MKLKRLLCVIGLVLSATLAEAALTTTNSWVSATSGFWSNATSWSTGVAPTNTQDDVLITNAASKTILIDQTTPVGNLTINNLTIEGIGTSTNTLLLTNTVSVSRRLTIIGRLNIFTNAALTVSNSTLQVDSVGGEDFVIDGTVILDGGSINNSSGGALIIVGSSGRGNLTLKAGTILSQVLQVGDTAVGTLTLAGGSLTNNTSLTVGGNATGVVWVTGGQLVVANSPTTIGNAGFGRVTISNGLMHAQQMFVAHSGSGCGTITVNGGTLVMTGPLTVGAGGNTTGTVWVTGGQLVVTNNPALVGAGSGFLVDGSVTLTNGSSIVVSKVDTVIGNAGSGSLTAFGGSMLVSNLIVGNLTGSRGTLTMLGGAITTRDTLTLGGSAGATGTLWMTGGRLVVTNHGVAHIVIGDAGSGAMIVSNGTVQFDQMFTGNKIGGSGTITVAGGTNISVSTFILGQSAFNTGTVWVTSGVFAMTNSGRTATTQIALNGVGQVTVSNGVVLADRAFVASLGTTGRGTITVAGGTTIINTNMVLGNLVCTSSGFVNVEGGALYVTNAAHNAVLEVRSGTLAISGGLLQADIIVITNSCAFFARTGGTLVYSNAVLTTNRDDDGDGIPNGYEQSHGLDPLDASDAGLDADGDGLSNLAEFLAGTDPTNSGSTFRITSVLRTNNDVRITWMMGSSKTNALQVTSGTGNGSYATNGFANLFIVTNTVGTTTNFLDVGGATNRPSRYYRVRLVP